MKYRAVLTIFNNADCRQRHCTCLMVKLEMETELSYWNLYRHWCSQGTKLHLKQHTEDGHIQ